MELFILLYWCCSIISYAMLLAYLDAEFREIGYGRNLITAIVVSLLGPFSLIVALACTTFGKYGLKFK